MAGIPLAFASPWLMAALISLPVIWWLLRLTPPRPQQEVFPPTRILARLQKKEDTPAQSPWWLTLLRLLIAALVITAMAGPLFNPQDASLDGKGPLMLVIDDGWTSANDWENRQETAIALLEEARSAGRPVLLKSASDHSVWPDIPMGAAEAISLLQAATTRPLFPSHQTLARKIDQLAFEDEGLEIAFLSDGLLHEGTQALAAAIERKEAQLKIFSQDNPEYFVMNPVRNEPGMMIGSLGRSRTDIAQTANLLARDEQGLAIATTSAVFGIGDRTADFRFTEPVELRNEITRVEIEINRTAASVQLLDDSNTRRLVGLISGAAFDQTQPLLSPLYYISRALGPFSDIRRSGDVNMVTAVPDLINQNVSAMVLADVGKIPDDVSERLENWLEKGGMLIRFAGPRLGASAGDETLLPVDIRPGDRQLGGALSWETPKPLAPFEAGSPFFGLEAPRDVLVKKQLLPLQEARLEEKTWAVLDDGTPLVTADRIGSGWVVLFHVGSDTQWSNLPLSGAFVEMLRRTVSLSRSSSTLQSGTEERVLPPLRLLDSTGTFTEPELSAKPLVGKPGVLPAATVDNAPGLYGTSDGYEALNLIQEKTELTPLNVNGIFTSAEKRAYLTGRQYDLAGWLLAAAAILFILDCMAVLWMAGAFRRTRISSIASTALVLWLASVPIFANPAHAQDGEFDYSAALKTRLAYVITGLDDVDMISEAGMRGLTLYLQSRTALEPGEPVGVDISKDELSFYSLLYWPVDPRAVLPSQDTMARVDAFMKKGGSILFDTRDQLSGPLGGTANSPASITLQQMLSTLDIPSLEPVPQDHVLTKAFYLLETFPGRFSGGTLWVQVSQEDESDQARPARVGDGVSAILITSNDFAGAWAIDERARPLLPTVPSDPAQRNYAFRVGVNLMMYTLTGNYKSDQVHLPALLERLGQ